MAASMGKGGRRGARVLLVAVMAVMAGAFGLSGTSSADVTSVSGDAFGYQLNVSLFSAPQPQIGPTPVVTLPAGGSAVPITDTAATGSARAGPAQFFSSGPITVSTEGTLGPTGFVTSSTDIQTINTSGQEAFTAASLASTCTASETGSTGETTITGGGLFTDSGNDINGDNDYTDPGEHPPVFVDLPVDPDPNTAYEGHIHVNDTQDNFRYVFNEQVTNSDGSITVNAAHQFLLGPTAVGDLIIGQSRCAVTGTGIVTTTTTRPTSTTSTTRPTSTTTTRPSTTTTTRPSVTTTTTPVPPGVSCGGLTATIVGTPGPDRLVGTDGPDVIAGLGGDDKIWGLDGDDVVCGGGGNDTVEAGAGHDTVAGGAGDDRLVGTSGRDLLRGGDGNDDLVGGSGRDHLNGGPGTDACNGGSGINTYSNCTTITPAPVPGSPGPTSSFSSTPTLRAPQV